MLPTLKIEVLEPNKDQDFQVIKFVGSFDKAGHADVKEQLENSIKEFSLKYLVFDFAELKFINSEGIGYLMEIHTHLVQRERKLIVLGLNDHVKDVFQTIGIAEIIPVFGDLNDFINKN